MVKRKRKLADKAKTLVKKATKSASSKVHAAADLNDNGTIDSNDAKISAAWTRRYASAVGKGASELAKSALRTDRGKDAAAGAAIGAAVALPVPVVGPLAGAAIGAGVGVIKRQEESFIKIRSSKDSASNGAAQGHHAIGRGVSHEISAQDGCRREPSAPLGTVVAIRWHRPRHACPPEKCQGGLTIEIQYSKALSTGMLSFSFSLARTCHVNPDCRHAS